MSTDYLAQRQNAVKGAHEELNAKLAALAIAFDEAWLTADGHPLQALWARRDALATNELLNFGDAVQRLHAESPHWLAGQVDTIKTGDAGQSAGAVFEITALNLFSRDFCKVEPAPRAKSGFDGTLVLNDGSRILLSVKNHGLSTPEQAFQARSKAFDSAFQTQLAHHGLNGVEVNVLAKQHLDDAAYKVLTDDLDACLAQAKAGERGGELDRPYTIIMKGMEDQYGPLSTGGLTSTCRVMSPIARNEQRNFEDAIRKGCENLLKHTKAETDVCRMIILRLSNSASIARCRAWAEWYFGEYPDDPVDVILLYQAGVTTDLAANASVITHHVAAITGPNFRAWQTAKPGFLRRLPSMSVLVGVISEEQPRMLLTGNVPGGADLSDWYVYQRSDIFKKVELVDGAGGDLSTPAPGVMIHVVIEQNGIPQMTLSSRSDREHVLALLP